MLPCSFFKSSLPKLETVAFLHVKVPKTGDAEVLEDIIMLEKFTPVECEEQRIRLPNQEHSNSEPSWKILSSIKQLADPDCRLVDPG